MASLRGRVSRSGRAASPSRRPDRAPWPGPVPPRVAREGAPRAAGGALAHLLQRLGAHALARSHRGYQQRLPVLGSPSARDHVARHLPCLVAAQDLLRPGQRGLVRRDLGRAAPPLVPDPVGHQLVDAAHGGGVAARAEVGADAPAGRSARRPRPVAQIRSSSRSPLATITRVGACRPRRAARRAVRASVAAGRRSRSARRRRGTPDGARGLDRVPHALRACRRCPPASRCCAGMSSMKARNASCSCSNDIT